MDKETDGRFAAVETKIAYLEDYIDQLQQVSVAQTKQMDILRQMIQSLSERVEETQSVPIKRPPHY